MSVDNKQVSSLDEAAEKFAKESFIWPKNKEGEDKVQIVGQNPYGWRKHLNMAKKAFYAAIEWQSQQKETKPTGLSGKEKIIEAMKERRDYFDSKIGHSDSSHYVSNAIDLIQNFFPPEYFDNIFKPEETKPVEDKAEKKYSYKITEHESYIIAYKVNTFEERTIAICDNAEKADFICKALNLCSNNPELLETQKPVSEEGEKKS